MRLVQALLLLLAHSSLIAQRAFEEGGNVIYQNAQGNRTNLGSGFSPVMTAQGRVAFVRGRRFGYGEKFDCFHPNTKNWIALYDPAIRSERALFDQVVPFENGKWPFCIFDQMQLSPDGSVLYLVSPVYATAGSLAIVQLATGSISNVPGVNNVFIIESGPRRGELIYVRRGLRTSADGLSQAAYLFFHARADGQPITEVSDRDEGLPILRQYLRKIRGRITLGNEQLP